MIIQRFISISGDAMLLFGSFMYSGEKQTIKQSNRKKRTNQNNNNNNNQIHMPKCEKWQEMGKEGERGRGKNNLTACMVLTF